MNAIQNPRILGSIVARLLLAALAASVVSMGGCNIVGIVGGMAESYKMESTHKIEAKYSGLHDKTVAVVVSADPTVSSKFPQLIGYVCSEVTARLADPANDSRVAGVALPVEVLGYLYNHPGWAAKSITDLASDLGDVQAIIMIEINDYHLNEPGNSYLWAGVASGDLGVFDLTSTTPTEYSYRTAINVKFPDKGGQGPETFPAKVIDSQLARRFIDRASWPFYDHQEPYYPKY